MSKQKLALQHVHLEGVSSTRIVAGSTFETSKSYLQLHPKIYERASRNTPCDEKLGCATHLSASNNKCMYVCVCVQRPSFSGKFVRKRFSPCVLGCVVRLFK